MLYPQAEVRISRVVIIDRLVSDASRALGASSLTVLCRAIDQVARDILASDCSIAEPVFGASHATIARRAVVIMARQAIVNSSVACTPEQRTSLVAYLESL